MTTIRQEAGVSEPKVRNDIDLEQFVMPATERGQDADTYIRELRDNDRILEELL